MKPIRDLLTQLQIHPRRLSLYEEALTHPTFAHEQQLASYQRLEFLGDAILDKFVAEYIYREFPTYGEGQMTELRAKVVASTALAQRAQSLNLHQYMRIGTRAEALREKASVLADIFEAFLAALYLDLGEAPTYRFLSVHFYPHIIKASHKEVRNAKTLLQEQLQAQSNAKIKYMVEQEASGYLARVVHEGKTLGTGTGPTKKAAEISAASVALRAQHRDESPEAVTRKKPKERSATH